MPDPLGLGVGVSEFETVSDGVSEGEFVGDDGVSDGDEGVSEGEDGVSDGDEGVSEGEDGVSDGDEGVSEGDEGVSEGEEGVSDGDEGVGEQAGTGFLPRPLSSNFPGASHKTISKFKSFPLCSDRSMGLTVS